MPGANASYLCTQVDWKEGLSGRQVCTPFCCVDPTGLGSRHLQLPRESIAQCVKAGINKLEVGSQLRCGLFSFSSSSNYACKLKLLILSFLWESQGERKRGLSLRKHKHKARGLFQFFFPLFCLCVKSCQNWQGCFGF